MSYYVMSYFWDTLYLPDVLVAGSEGGVYLYNLYSTTVRNIGLLCFDMI